MTEVLKREIISLSEVKKILESIPEDEMDQIRAMDVMIILKNFQKLIMIEQR